MEQETNQANQAEHVSGGNKGFFAVSQRAFADVCTRLGSDAAAAYLILARGSGRDNRTTAWSVAAVQRYTGLTLGRAKEAVRLLHESKPAVMVRTRGGSRPLYELTAAAISRPVLAADETAIVEEVRNGWQPGDGRTIKRSRAIATARKLVQSGWLLEDPNRRFSVAPEPADELVWLPNAIVDGVGDEIPPVMRLRQSQDPPLLRLFVDCYQAQHLTESGGISRQYVYTKYDRVKVGQQGQYVVWGFKPEGHTWVTWNGFTLCHKREPTPEELNKEPQRNAGSCFFERWTVLRNLGLIQHVHYLMESDAPDAQPIHPYGEPLWSSETELEDKIAAAAHKAAERMLTAGQVEWANKQGLGMLVPVPAHFVNAHMVGIFRLRYRPHTKRTAAWWADLQTKGSGYLAQYRKLAGLKDEATGTAA